MGGIFLRLAELEGGLKNLNNKEVKLYDGIRNIILDAANRRIFGKPADADNSVDSIYRHEKRKKITLLCQVRALFFNFNQLKNLGKPTAYASCA